jgi:uncharacterized protein (DUF1778 family)
MKARDRQSQLIALRLTPDEYRALARAAETAKLSVSEYIRRKLDLRGEQQ